MNVQMSLIEATFFRGEYENLAKSFEGGLFDQSLAERPKDYAYIMGAFSFLGRLEETEKLLAKLITHRLPLSVLSQCQFYYILLLTRLSHYKKAREQIIKLLSRRNQIESDSRFYALQALAFYRYYQGRYGDALKNSEYALKFARGPYETFLAKDLLGHIHSQLGQTAMGENFFQGALALANSIGLVGFEKMVRFSIMGYQIERGENLINASKAIEEELQSTPTESFFSRSMLHLMQAKIYRLKGEKDLALEVLNNAGLTIFRHHNRRHMALLYLNMAYIDMLGDSFGRALQLLEVGLTQLDSEMDLDHQLKLKGLKYKLLKKLKLTDGASFEALRSEIASLTTRVGRQSAKKIYEREHNIQKTNNFEAGKDGMGDILDHLQSNSSLEALSLREWEVIYKDRLLGLIDQTKEKESNKGKTLFIIGKIPKSFIVGENGNYLLAEKGLTPMSLKLCRLLYQNKSLSKEDITRSLYGLEYNPLTHDSLIHALISRLRKGFGNYSWIIQNDDGLYKWAGNCELIDCLEDGSESDEPSHAPKPLISQAKYQLNIRQHKLLERARRGELESITPGEYREIFQVSRITATRDLSELTELGHFYTLGKARSISYIYENEVRS